MKNILKFIVIISLFVMGLTSLQALTNPFRAVDNWAKLPDGHEKNGNNRVVKFSSDGKYIKEWGSTGYGPVEFRQLNAIAIDQRGRTQHAKITEICKGVPLK